MALRYDNHRGPGKSLLNASYEFALKQLGIVVILIIGIFPISIRVLSTTTLTTGQIKILTTLLEDKRDSTHKKPSYQPIGIHLLPRSVSV